MTPTHHVPESLLASYATGGVTEGESLLVACHAQLCPECRLRITRLEQIGGALLGAEAARDVSADLWARTLRAAKEAPSPAPVVAPPVDPILPASLARLVGPSDRLAWKKAVAGVYYLDLPVKHGAVPVRLRRIGAGMRVPTHSHRGAELELVLAGGAVDESDGRRYERGDVAAKDARDIHSLRIEPDGDCVVLGVQDARLAPKGLWSRMVFGYLGW